MCRLKVHMYIDENIKANHEYACDYVINLKKVLSFICLVDLVVWKKQIFSITETKIAK